MQCRLQPSSPGLVHLKDKWNLFIQTGPSATSSLLFSTVSSEWTFSTSPTASASSSFSFFSPASSPFVDSSSSLGGVRPTCLGFEGLVAFHLVPLGCWVGLPGLRLPPLCSWVGLLGQGLVASVWWLGKAANLPETEWQMKDGCNTNLPEIE